MRIGYGKIGRSWNLDPAKWSAAGGDVDVWRLLNRLARERPGDTFVLVGRNSGEDPQSVGLPPNVENPWTPELQDARRQLCAGNKSPMTPEQLARVEPGMNDLTRHMYDDLGAVMVWAGQHGTSNRRIPDVPGTKLTKPQDAFVYYAGFIINGVNRWRWSDPLAREEIWLVPDPRNYVKARDLAYPLRRPVLAQFEQKRQMKHERYGDDRDPAALGFEAEWEASHWVTQCTYAYSGLELTALPESYRDVGLPTLDLDGREPFGLVMNENRRQVSNPRITVLKNWVLPTWPDVEIYGHWSKASLKELDRDIQPCGVMEVDEVLGSWRSTFTTPASGSGWATAKAWECFAVGTVCFFHPGYDTQGHIIPTLEQVEKGRVADPDLAMLARWLRVESPEQLKKRVERVATDDNDYVWLVEAQRKRLRGALTEDRIGSMVRQRLGENA